MGGGGHLHSHTHLLEWASWWPGPELCLSACYPSEAVAPGSPRARGSAPDHPHCCLSGPPTRTGVWPRSLSLPRFPDLAVPPPPKVCPLGCRRGWGLGPGCHSRNAVSEFVSSGRGRAGGQLCPRPVPCDWEQGLLLRPFGGCPRTCGCHPLPLLLAWPPCPRMGLQGRNTSGEVTIPPPAASETHDGRAPAWGAGSGPFSSW